MRSITLRLLLALLALSAWPALASRSPPKKHDPRAAFAETDKNKDGKVDREEFHQRVMEIFFFGDKDKDGYMTQPELIAAVVFPDDFADADRNGDGSNSLPRVRGRPLRDLRRSGHRRRRHAQRRRGRDRVRGEGAERRAGW